MKKYKIENLCTVRSSKRIFANQYTNDGIPFYRGKEITLLSLGQKISDLLYINDKAYDDIKTNGVPKENDILITAVGTIGSVWLIDHNTPFYFKDGNIIWLSSINADIVLPKYLKYLLTSSAFQRKIEEISIGSNQKALTIDALKKQEIDVPALNIQQHIVDILGSIDDSIENNEKIAADLEDYAISKYQELTRGIRDFIPLGEIVDIYDSKRKPLSSRERESRKGDYRYYGATGVLDYVNDYLFDGEYVLLAEDGTVIDENGYPIVQLVTGQFWVNNHAHIMQAKAGYTNYSLYVALKKLSVNTAVTGAVQLKINQANLCALELPKIDENELSAFNQDIEPLFLKMIHIRAEIEKLNELKQLYLHKFFG